MTSSVNVNNGWTIEQEGHKRFVVYAMDIKAKKKIIQHVFSTLGDAVQFAHHTEAPKPVAEPSFLSKDAEAAIAEIKERLYDRLQIANFKRHEAKRLLRHDETNFWTYESLWLKDLLDDIEKR